MSRRACLVASALGLWSSVAHADSPLLFRLSPHAGWAGLYQSTTTDTPGGGTDTNIGMLVYGADASMGISGLPLVLKGELLLGGTTIDSVDVTPAETNVGFTRFALGLGWQFWLSSLGPLRRITPRVGFAHEGVSADEQSPTQVTPAFTHNEVVLGVDATMTFLDEDLAVRGTLDLVPWMSVDEDFATSGESAGGFGYDATLSAEYLVWNMPNEMGEILLGARAGFAQRFIDHEGEGTRLAQSGAPVADVRERYARVTALGVLSWRFPGGVEGVRVTDEGITIESEILFATGSATLDMSRSRAALVSVARLLNARADIGHVEVRGHTDNEGDSKVNLDLSQRRAQAVVDALVAMGVERSRLSARGFGDTVPKAPNTSETGRALNRRVEFIIVD
jgi:outer membrane protein OmpA-like peptidoglycan-associated protein